MAKGGKGRKGGGGGGGKTRKYSRDNKGRFASTGSGGATARGGRLKTASGNKRKTQTITAKGQKGVLAKPKGLKPGSIGLKPAAAKPARFSASELAERKGYAKQLMAQPKGVRKANYLARKAQKTPDQLDRFKGRIKFGTQNTINNITEGRNYLTAKKSQLTNTSEKRASIERSVTNSGRSLQARMKTTNLGTRLRRLNKPVTTKAAKTKGTIGKPKGLKPESTNKLKTGIFISKRRAVNAQLANKPDQAVVNIPGRFTGRAGKSFDASITRAVATVKASKDAKFKTKAEVKADQAKAKAAKEAKPKRIRSAESLRVSRAKQIEKRRSITTNPAGVRASAAAKMAANATRTQQRAAAFYKAGGKPAAAAKPATRKEQLAAGAKKRTAQADRIDAKIKKLESEYRGKDAAFYTQGAKPAGRDRMIAKSQKAAQLREESASLRTKAANAERMSSKIKDKPIKSSGGNKRLDRAIKNEAAGSTSYKRNPKGYQKRITALTAQKVYQTGDATTGLSVAQYAGKGFRLPRNQRAAAAKPAAPKAAKAPKGGMRATKRGTLAPDSATAKRLAMFKSDKQLTDQRTKSLRAGLKKETNPVEKIKTLSAISESQLKSKRYGDDITRMQARPIMGKRTGIGRGDKPVSGPAAKRANTMKGKVKRDPKAASKAPKALNLNAGRYKNIYIDRANTKGKAAAKAAKRPMR
jgi:hypothetical protein